MADIGASGGVGIRHQYPKASLQTILSSVFPEEHWSWKLSETSLKSYFEELAKKLKVI